MSYCVLPYGLPKTKKLTIVFWFRVRKATLDRVTKIAKAFLKDPPPSGRPPMLGVIPLIILGDKNYHKVFTLGPDRILSAFHFQQYFWSDSGLPTGHEGPGWYPTGSASDFNETTHDFIFTGERIQIDPSYIGIDCFGEYPTLSINMMLPSNNIATYKGGIFPKELPRSSNTNLAGLYLGGGIAPGAPSYYIFAPGTPYQDINMDIVNNGPIPGLITNVFNYGDSQGNIMFGATPEMFRTRPVAELGQSTTALGNGIDFFSDRGMNGPRVTPDKWHSVAFSIDTTNKVENKTRFIYRNFVESRVTGLSDVVSQSGDSLDVDPYNDFTKYVKSTVRMFLAFDDVNLTGKDLSVFYPPGYKDKNGVLSANAFVIGNTTVFSSKDYTQPRLGIAVQNETRLTRGEYSLTPEKFEFDTSIGFPSTSEYDGQINEVQMGALQAYTDKIVDWGVTKSKRAFITSKGYPAPIKDAVDLMGKKPEIWMPKRSNFINAENSGTYNKDTKGTVTGVIDPFNPDPSLYGPQEEIPLEKK